MSWREMQVLPQPLPVWQILQQVWDVEVERAVRPVEWAEDEGDAHRVLLWMTEGKESVAVVDDGAGEFARADVVNDRKTMKTTRARGMGFVRGSPVNCRIFPFAMAGPYSAALLQAFRLIGT